MLIVYETWNLSPHMEKNFSIWVLYYIKHNFLDCTTSSDSKDKYLEQRHASQTTLYFGELDCWVISSRLNVLLFVAFIRQSSPQRCLKWFSMKICHDEKLTIGFAISVFMLLCKLILKHHSPFVLCLLCVCVSVSVWERSNRSERKPDTVTSIRCFFLSAVT